MNERPFRSWVWVMPMGALAILAGLFCFTSMFSVQTSTEPVLTPEKLQELKALNEEYLRQQSITLSDLEERLQESLLAAQDEVDAFRAGREGMPSKDRCRIYAADDAFTDAKFREQKFQYRMQATEWYRKNTSDSGEAKRLGERFLEEYAKMAAQTRDPLDQEALREVAQSAIDAGADDPMVRAFYARVLWVCGEKEAARSILAGVWDVARRAGPGSLLRGRSHRAIMFV